MTNPIFNPQPNYSGVTIQIANPAVNVGTADRGQISSSVQGYYGVNQNGLSNIPANYVTYPQVYGTQQPLNALNTQSTPEYTGQQRLLSNSNIGYPTSYPAQYYLNNYNYGFNDDGTNGIKPKNELNNVVPANQLQNPSVILHEENKQLSNPYDSAGVNSYKMYAKNDFNNEDMSKSESIKDDIAQREAEMAEAKKNTKETKIVALTDEYIKSLENYLNNPNDEIRLMASKEILTRLDEDKDRFDDAALNALLNKMMQDPNKLVRLSALSAFSSQLASGNDYTVSLLHNIQSNPNSDKEDVLQAADILLKMSADVEVKNIPNPSIKENTNK